MARTTLPTRQNLIVRSEELSNASWNANSSITVTADDTTAPDGTVTADLLTPTAVNDRHYANEAFVMPAAYQMSPRRITVSAFMKGSGAQWATLGNDRHTDFIYAWFDLTNGVVGSVTADNPSAISVVSQIVAASTIYPSAPAGWYRCTMSYLMVSPGGGAGSAADGLFIGPTTGDTVQVFNDVTKTIWAWGAQMVVGANWAGQYQKTVAAQVDTGSIRSLNTGGLF